MTIDQWISLLLGLSTAISPIIVSLIKKRSRRSDVEEDRWDER